MMADSSLNRSNFFGSHHHHHHPNASSNDDEILLFLHQFLLRHPPSTEPPPQWLSQSSPTNNNNNNMYKPWNSVSDASDGIPFSGTGSGCHDPEEYDDASEEAAVDDELQKPPPRNSSSKRTRSADVHNLSEKRRRSRINEKMKALQKLIPNSSKTDKASMLDEAIEYLKQLQLQVQMLSMRNGVKLDPMCNILESMLHQNPRMDYFGGEASEVCPLPSHQLLDKKPSAGLELNASNLRNKQQETELALAGSILRFPHI